MADQKDQGTDPPAEKPAFLPLKKRSMAEKHNRAPESNSESDGDGSDDGGLICLSKEEAKKQTFQELQLKAFYSVLQAFALETSTMSNKRTQVIEKLMKEWEISDETHITFADKIQKNLLTLQQMEKEMQIVPEMPLTKPATPSRTFVPISGKSWVSDNPESLIGKRVRIRLDEAEFDEYIITAYDAKREMHHLMTPDSDAMEVDDPYSWTDLREISPKDIMLEGGQPNIDAPKKSAGATARRALF